MPEFKVVIGLKDGKCKQIEVKDPDSRAFIGKKVSDKIAGESINLAGWEFEISGGSDNAGFPMRKDVLGVGRKRILAIDGVGLKKKGKGIRQRKTVAGNTIHPGIAQINLKTLKEGSAKIEVEAKAEEGEAEEDFKFADLIKLITNRSFMFIALLCVTFYSAVFPLYNMPSTCL